MPEFLVDTCITVNAPSLEVADQLVAYIAEDLRHHSRYHTAIAGIHVCNVEQTEPTLATVEPLSHVHLAPVVNRDPGDESPEAA